jgi:hypothetical protein
MGLSGNRERHRIMIKYEWLFITLSLVLTLAIWLRDRAKAK